MQTNLQGGYYMLKEPIIKTGTHKHTSALSSPIGPVMIEALNLIQATPFAIDGWVAQQMKEAYERNDAIGEMPVAEPLPLPDKVSEDVWEDMTKEEKLEHKAKLAEIHAINGRLVGKRRAFKRKLKLAFELMGEPAIYFPSNFDFRLRIYPLPQDLNPQGDDIAKALLRFAEGKPLTGVGAYWLAVAVANAFGQDKMAMDERMKWTMAHSDLLIDSVEEPLDGQRFWTTADEPWSALALAKEFVGWLAEGDDYVSYRPVNLDATCSGMQHLSALARDPIGAKATNLTSCPIRQDLYSEVAKVVTREVEKDAAAGVEAAQAWLNNITRKTVKRAVMTTPYGVTDRGVRDQLIEDGFVDGLAGNPIANAEYMKEKIKAAMGETAEEAKEIMAYIQGVAKALAEKHIPFEWATPAGSRIRQTYFGTAESRIYTVFGRANLWTENADLGINARKQALASAPNFVHSYDASHLAMTVVRANRQFGIRHFAMIHDSYGCHAADIPNLNQAIRESFVEIYAEDWLAKLEEEVRAYAPDIELPPRPAVGTFDVTEVLKAPFFFS